jgi:hypothetical protein
VSTPVVLAARLSKITAIERFVYVHSEAKELESMADIFVRLAAYNYVIAKHSKATWF